MVLAAAVNPPVLVDQVTTEDSRKDWSTSRCFSAQGTARFISLFSVGENASTCIVESEWNTLEAEAGCLPPCRQHRASHTRHSRPGHSKQERKKEGEREGGPHFSGHIRLRQSKERPSSLPHTWHQITRQRRLSLANACATCIYHVEVFLSSFQVSVRNEKRGRLVGGDVERSSAQDCTETDLSVPQRALLDHEMY